MLEDSRSLGHYHAYGLKIRSEIPLDELTPVPEEFDPDVDVRLGSIDFKPDVMSKDGYGMRAEPNRACHQFKFAGSFLVENGNSIIVEPDSDAEDRALRLSILGPAMSLAIIQRGDLVMHGSCVQIGDTSVAFVGGHRWGKSTLAASLEQRGHRLITDDVLRIMVQDGAINAQPSYPQIKLWPDSVEALGKKKEELAVLHPEIDKFGFRDLATFTQEPARLSRIYVLGKSDCISSTTLPKQDAFLSLMQHWYGCRWGDITSKIVQPQLLMRQISDVVGNCEVMRLTRPIDLQDLDAVAEFVENDMA